ncbi:hypothetical protein [Streptomyces sp. NPDC058955]|uniref:hypothetical protein n=1 Tax=unclassified Streptomyces TaxID=2593676 RepID=UPI0036561520
MASGADLAAAVVDLVAQAGSAALTGAGGAVGGMAVELVRGRLSGVAQGPEALAAVEQAPDDADARGRLRAKLAEVLAEDPAFAAYLASVLAPPRPTHPPTTVGSIHIDRNARARGTFVLGDQAITRIRKGDPVAVVSLVAVVVVLALALYGLAGLVGGDGEGEGGRGWSGSGGGVTVLKDPETVKAVLPDLHSMPTGWTIASEPSVLVGEAACADVDRSCDGVLSVAQSSFHDQFDQSANFGVVACGSVEDARRVYKELLAEPQANSEAKPLAVPALGQESAAFEISQGMGQAIARVGTTLVFVEEKGSNSDYQVETLEKLLRMAAARAQEAQDGRTPGASAG